MSSNFANLKFKLEILFLPIKKVFGYLSPRKKCGKGPLIFWKLTKIRWVLTLCVLSDDDIVNLFLPKLRSDDDIVDFFLPLYLYWNPFQFAFSELKLVYTSSGHIRLAQSRAEPQKKQLLYSMSWILIWVILMTLICLVIVMRSTNSLKF